MRRRDILSRKVLVSIALDEGWRESSGFGPEVSVIMCQVDRHVLSFNQILQRCPAKRSTVILSRSGLPLGSYGAAPCVVPWPLLVRMWAVTGREAELNDHGRRQTSIDE